MPPAGFEPALTAPEGVAVYCSDLALCTERGAVGRIWGARNVGLSESHERERTAPTHKVAVAIGAYRAVHKLSEQELAGSPNRKPPVGLGRGPSLRQRRAEHDVLDSE